MAGAPKDNTNAEKWTLEDATVFMNDAVELSKDKEYDFIGEVARDLNQYHQLFGYLSNKFPSLKHAEKLISANCEANCFLNGKKSKIVPSLAIMNLKSNHGWTDRVDNTTKGETLNNSPLSNEERAKFTEGLDEDI